MKINRRDLFKLAGITAAGFVLSDCTSKDKKDRAFYVPSSNVRGCIENAIDDYQNSRLVVGETAPASDVIGAIDIQTALNQEIVARYGSGSLPPASLDSEIMRDIHHFKGNAFQNNNLISVGNSQNSMVTNYLRMNPEPWDTGLPDDKGVIQFSKYMREHIAATGKTDVDVRKATEVLADFKNYNLVGKLIYVSGDISTGLVTEIIVP